VVEQAELKIGSGWRTVGGPIWLLEDVEGGAEAVLARWKAGVGGALVREMMQVRVSQLQRGLAGLEPRNWVPVSEAEVDALVSSLMRSDAADELHGLRQRARDQDAGAEGAAVDRERAETRRERHVSAEVESAVPVREKSYWAGMQADRIVLDETAAPAAVPEPLYRSALATPGEVRANAPVGERVGIDPPRSVRFEHDYPGAPGYDPDDPGECFTSDCRYGCGCYAGPSTSGARDKTVDPFGECPKHPELLKVKGSLTFRALVEEQGMAPDEALRAALGSRERQVRQRELADHMEDVGSRMIYEARELRKLAGVNDEQDGGADGGA
jgi:hypothetical protein